MSVTATDQSPFPYAEKLFPDSYFGQTEPVTHHLPIYSEGDSPSFKDVLDTLNPLQHLPIISTIYRAVTGDEPGAGSRLAGAALYGGPIGLVGELINCAIDDNTGKDVGEHMVAMVEDAFGSSPSGGADTKLATASPGTAPATAAKDASAKDAGAKDGTGTQVAAAEPPPPMAAPQALVTAEPVKLAAADLTPPAAPGPTAPFPTGPAPARAMPLARAAPMRFMPPPQRQPVQPVQPAPVTVPLSNSSEMSHVPITGRPTYVSSGPSAAAVQRVLASEGQANAPLGAGPPGMTAPGVTPPPAGQDWFTAAMSQALDKYQKTSRLTAPATAAPATATP